MVTKLWLALALVGCYSDFRLGASAPVGHGHGSYGADVGVSAGGAYLGDGIRAGGGFVASVHAAEVGGFVPVGVEGRVDVGLSGPDDKGRRFSVTAYAMAGGEVGLSNQDGSGGTPDGLVAQGFLGLGASAPRPASGDWIVGGAASLGVLVTRFAPDSGSGYWLVGIGLDVSASWDLDAIFGGR